MCFRVEGVRITILQGPFYPVPPVKGGAVGKMWFELGAEFAARGHVVTDVSRRYPGFPDEETRRGVRFMRVPSVDHSGATLRNLLRDYFYTRRAARVMPEADVVVANTFWAPLVLARRHGAIYVDLQRMPKGRTRFYGRAARIRANSSAVERAVLAESPRVAARVRVIPNPLPFVPERLPIWNAKRQTILFAGRIHPEKGIELLLEAWARVRAAGRLHDWTLELVGPVDPKLGGGGEAWLREVQRRHPSDGVQWHPPVFDVAALNAIYERATVFVYPSLAVQGETFGLAVLEAMAWGAVPVVSQLACFQDFVTPGKNGYAFAHDGADAAAALAEAIEAAARPESRALAERALAVRETHSCSSIATQFLEDFARLT